VRQYVIKRLGLLVPTVLAMVFLAFVIIHLAPGDPVDLLHDVDRRSVSPEQLQEIRRSLGLDRPLVSQFLTYLSRVTRGDLGMSISARQPVASEIARNAPATVRLAFAGVLVAALIGIPAGMLAALYRNTWIDHAALAAAILGIAAPNFWIGILLIYVFGFVLGWLPISGSQINAPDTVALLILPGLTVGAAASALLARLTRSAVLEVLRQEYVRTAWAKGLRPRRVIALHVMRNAAIPVVTALGLSFAGLMGGSVVVELVFSRRGLGWLLVGAVNNRDYTLLQGLILMYGVAVVLINLGIDLLYGLLDPRVRYA
jgi:peptide/nickel transport system permease protein